MIRRFLKRVGHQPLKTELTAIMRRFDLDGDAKLSFQEFTEAFTPIQPNVYYRSNHRRDNKELTIQSNMVSWRNSSPNRVYEQDDVHENVTSPYLQIDELDMKTSINNGIE